MYTYVHVHVFTCVHVHVLLAFYEEWSHEQDFPTLFSVRICLYVVYGSLIYGLIRCFISFAACVRWLYVVCLQGFASFHKVVIGIVAVH